MSRKPFESANAQDRVLPSLLDRLTDDEPDNRYEARDMRVFSLSRLREAVVRDLSWLLNTANLAATQDLRAVPHAASSVLNYGVPPTTGAVKAGIDPAVLTRQLKAAIMRFEPRLLPDSLEISVTEQNDADTDFQFIIEAELFAYPLPVRLTLRTEPDRDLDMVRVVEQDFRPA
jgi:type VI secretion system protein ImpF